MDLLDHVFSTVVSTLCDLNEAAELVPAVHCRIDTVSYPTGDDEGTVYVVREPTIVISMAHEHDATAPLRVELCPEHLTRANVREVTLSLANTVLSNIIFTHAFGDVYDELLAEAAKHPVDPETGLM